jgi:hypothetical protein
MYPRGFRTTLRASWPITSTERVATARREVVAVRESALRMSCMRMPVAFSAGATPTRRPVHGRLAVYEWLAGC